MICSTTELLDTDRKYLGKVFLEKNNYPKWVIRHIFRQVKFINGTNLSPPTIETIEIPANENETVTKKHMLNLSSPTAETIKVPENEHETVTKRHVLLLSYQGVIDIGLTKSLKRNLDKHLPNNVTMQVTFTGQKLSTQFNC